MQVHFAARTFLCGLTLTCAASAQEIGGFWDRATSGALIEFYVAPTGTPGGAGTPTSPFRTITQALTLMRLIQGDPVTNPGPGAPVSFSINVAPGVYDAAAGEAFPLRVPARGCSIESWPGNAAGPLAQPLITGNGFAPAFQIDWNGIDGLPASVIQQMEIEAGSPGILVNPDLLSAPAEDILEPELRENFIHDCGGGMTLVTGPDYLTRYVVEDNDIGDETPIVAFGVLELCDGTAATLYRSNRIVLWEEGLTVVGNGETCGPRLFSNFVSQGERTVNLFDCDSLVINNTIAFAVDFTAVPAVNGLTITGGAAQVDNNIIWNPLPPSATPAIDITVGGGAVVTFLTNLDEDAAGGLTPGFVGGDMHPGQALTDLHLAIGSAMIGAGTNASTANLVNTVRSRFTGAIIARTDINMDVDLDGRIFRSFVEPFLVPNVDIGADEYKGFEADGVLLDSRIDMVDAAGGAPATQDVFGNVLPQPFVAGTPTRSYVFDAFLQGPPNGPFTLFTGFTFFDDVMDPVLGVMTQNTAVYQNLLLLPINLGNVLIDLGAPLTVAVGNFDGAGMATANVAAFANLAEPFVESEVYLQMITTDPATGRACLSNRQKVELNEGVPTP